MDVTGTRIRQIDMEGAAPITTIDRPYIERSGVGSLQELLRKLPEAGAGTFSALGNDQDDTAPGGAGVSLRGLGADATLVLINGRRVAVSPWAKTITASFVDINTIPLAAIERIEVLKDGASALYGSDAIAGVVNIILRQDFSGFELNLDYGDTSEGEDAHEARASAVWGGSSGRGNGLLVLDYYKRGALMYRDRDVSATLDHRSQGGTDLRSAGSWPGTFQTPDGVWHIDPTCPPDRRSGGFCQFDYITFQAALPEAERAGALALFDYDFSASLQSFTELQVQRNKSLVVGAPSPSFFDFIVPDAHPDNPYGADVNMAYRFVESGPRTFDIETTNLRVLQGLRGLWRNWDWELAYHYSRSESEQVGIKGMVNQDLAQAAIDSFAYNPFGGFVNDPAVVSDFTVRTVREGESEMKAWDGRLSGQLLQLAHGPVGLAAGFEYREESIDDTPDAQFQRGLIIGTEATEAHGSRDVTSFYGELLVPLWRDLELQIAARHDDYSDFGTTTNPKLALRYQPVPPLTLRASWGTGFRAPSLAQMGLGPTDESPVLIDERRCALAGGGYCDPSEFPVRYSGNPDLDPEESESYNLGLVWQVATPLSITLDYWNYDIEERITRDSRQLLLQELSGTLPSGAILRAPPTPADIAAGVPGRIIEINDVLRNAASQETDGIDLNLKFRQPTRIGEFNLDFSLTRVLKFDEQLNEAAPTEDLNGAFERPQTRWLTSLDWQRGAWGATFTVNYIGEFDDNEDAGPVAAARTVDDWTTVDAQVRLMLTKGGTLRLGAINLFAEEVPFSAGTFQGFVPNVHDPRERFVYFNYTLSY